MVEGSLQQPPLVGMGVELSPTPKTSELSFLGLVLVHRALWEGWWKGSSDSHPLPSQGHPPEDLLISEGEVPLHLLPQLQYTFC